MQASDASRNAWLAYLSAALALTGVQMIAPALPVMKEALGLTDTDLGLVTSLYLLPGGLAAIPAGWMADRFGRRQVLGWSMIGFGACGAVLPLLGETFNLFLAVRFVQGMMFAGLLPLTITVLGDAFSGAELVGAQGRRSVAINFADGLLPILGGLLVAGGWFVPWFGQTSGIVIGFIILLRLSDSRAIEVAAMGRVMSVLVSLFRVRAVIVLQYIGILRMFLKFSILTFVPVLLVEERELSPVFAGVVVGSGALTGTLSAAFSGRLAKARKTTTWVSIGVPAMGTALIIMVVAPGSWAILTAALVYGAADGLMGVFLNAFVAAATDAGNRASFVAATGALRNFAKFMGPAAVGLLAIAVPVTELFVLLGLITVLSMSLVPLLRPIEQRLTE